VAASLCRAESAPRYGCYLGRRGRGGCRGYLRDGRDERDRLLERAASVARQAPDPVPALLIGRLAVDRRYSGLGVGTALVAHVLATALELNAKAACRAVVVNALHASARGWWQHLGVQPFDPGDEQSLDLYLLITEIDTTLRRIH